MKFIRDIIGEKQLQSQTPDAALYDAGAGADIPPVEVEEWSLPPIDLADGLGENISAAPEPEIARSPPGPSPVQPDPVTSRQRPHSTPEASVIRRALWPDEADSAANLPANDDIRSSEISHPDPDAPKFGRQAYLDAHPQEPASPTASADQPPARSGRVKTRLLGFGGDMAFPGDPIQHPSEAQSETGSPGFPVGWLVIVSGPGRGTCFTLQSGVAPIGRGEGQAVRLNFGDTSISRENHAAIAFDPERNAFFIGHGGKANLVRCNDTPVLATQELSAGDRVRIGETTLVFTPLCGPTFNWSEAE